MPGLRFHYDSGNVGVWCGEVLIYSHWSAAVLTAAALAAFARWWIG